MSTNDHYDLVIVGGGIAGATVAKTVIERAAAQKSPWYPHILILEAGRATAMSADKYDTYVDAYQQARFKVPNSPYPTTASAPQPDVLDIEHIGSTPSSKGYFVQKGPMPFGSDYTRALGGTTLHWLGTCLRMLPNDFHMKTMYGRGVDWPVTYEKLKPYYERAEWDIIGVAGNVEDQHYPGLDPAKYFQSDDKDRFGHGGYYFPMDRIPSSYLDNHLEQQIGDLTITLIGDKISNTDGSVGHESPGASHKFPIKVSNTPVARNSTPTHLYKNKLTGAVGNSDRGQRCEGNSSCIPICPAQAKYSALKTLYELIVTYPELKNGTIPTDKARVTVRSQCVVTKVQHQNQPAHKEDPAGTVTGLTYKTYFDDGRPPEEHTVTGDTYVLTANAIENATLLLASATANRSGQVGRNLMDHPLLLTWGLLPNNAGAFRGPGSTSGIPAFRDGSFRKERTAFRVEIGNWGWNFPENAPYDTVHDLVVMGEDGEYGNNGTDHKIGTKQLYGKALRRRLGEILPRQFRIAWELEQDPDPDNRVTIESGYRDALGKHRPVIHYKLSPYVCKSLPWAKQASDQLFTKLGIEKQQKRPAYHSGDYTRYADSDASAVTVGRETFWVRGAGHVVGTHRMGKDPTKSVVDEFQRSHDMLNLYIVGCGSMPTLGTSNPTLTMTALAIRTGDHIADERLKREHHA